MRTVSCHPVGSRWCRPRIGRGTRRISDCRFDAQGFAPAWVAGWANLRARLSVAYGDQGLLDQRSRYDAVGGYADIPLMEDVVMARALRGGRCYRWIMPSSPVPPTSARRWLRRGARNLMLLIRFFLGADPARSDRSEQRLVCRRELPVGGDMVIFCRRPSSKPMRALSLRAW